MASLNKSIIKARTFAACMAFIISFFNFYTCTVKSSSLSDYLFLSGLIFVKGVILLFVGNKSVICFMLLVTGFLNTIAITYQMGQIPYGVVFLVFALNIAQRRWLEYLVYLFIIVVSVTSKTMKGLSPIESFNTLIAYLTIFGFNHILFLGKGYNGEKDHNK